MKCETLDAFLRKNERNLFGKVAIDTAYGGKLEPPKSDLERKGISRVSLHSNLNIDIPVVSNIDGHAINGGGYSDSSPRTTSGPGRDRHSSRGAEEHARENTALIQRYIEAHKTDTTEELRFPPDSTCPKCGYKYGSKTVYSFSCTCGLELYRGNTANSVDSDLLDVELTPKEKIIVDEHLCGLGYGEIAKKHAIHKSTVKTLWRRAMERIRIADNSDPGIKDFLKKEIEDLFKVLIAWNPDSRDINGKRVNYEDKPTIQSVTPHRYMDIVAFISGNR